MLLKEFLAVKIFVCQMSYSNSYGTHIMHFSEFVGIICKFLVCGLPSRHRSPHCWNVYLELENGKFKQTKLFRTSRKHLFGSCGCTIISTLETRNGFLGISELGQFSILRLETVYPFWGHEFLAVSFCWCTWEEKAFLLPV